MAIFRNSLTDVAHSRGDLIDYSALGTLFTNRVTSSSSWFGLDDDERTGHTHTSTGTGRPPEDLFLRNFNREFLRIEQKKKLSHFLTVESWLFRHPSREREKPLPANLFRRVSRGSQSLPPTAGWLAGCCWSPNASSCFDFFKYTYV